MSRTKYSDGKGTGPTPYGGRGAYVSGLMSIGKVTLYVYVGEEGGYDNVTNNVTYNGGGNGCYTVIGSGSTAVADGAGSRGGGSTDIRRIIHSDSNGWGGNASLASRIIIAAGGGGCTTYGTDSQSGMGKGDGSGGAAGGLRGYSGLTCTTGGANEALAPTYATNAAGGNQSSGGSGWKWGGSLCHSQSGGYGYGGRPAMDDGWHYGAGGGAGLYGGGSGGVIDNVVGSAGGGSSFISGHPGCASISGYTFTSTKMIDGKGLLWTTAGQTTGGSAERMPTTTGGQEALNTGHTGHGYAKITSL